MPEWAPGAPKDKGCWTSPSPRGDQVQKLLGDIAKLKKAGVTRGSVVYNFMQHRLKPLQKRVHPSFRNRGLNDLSRFTPEKLTKYEVFKRVCRVLDDVKKLPLIPTSVINAKNPPEKAWIGVKVYQCLPPPPPIENRSLASGESSGDDRTLAEVLNKKQRSENPRFVL